MTSMSPSALALYVTACTGHKWPWPSMSHTNKKLAHIAYITHVEMPKGNVTATHHQSILLVEVAREAITHT